MKLTDAFFELLYPPRCIVCDEPIIEYGYCDNCKGKIKVIDVSMCLSCGCETKSCECNKRVYHFDGIAGPYFNKEYAKQTVYDLKFNNKFNCLKPFSKEMARVVKKSFGLENIDLICYVPSSKKSMYDRGFNQCELFAKEIASLLNIDIKHNVLIKKESVQTQHRKRTIEDRFKNVRNGYKATVKFNGENILLVDDIKTTGATIDECARQLKFAGADRVYCIAALLSEKTHGGDII